MAHEGDAFFTSGRIVEDHRVSVLAQHQPSQRVGGGVERNNLVAKEDEAIDKSPARVLIGINRDDRGPIHETVSNNALAA